MLALRDVAKDDTVHVSTKEKHIELKTGMLFSKEKKM